MPSIAPQDFESNNLIDYLIIGEGEISLIELITDIKNKKHREKVIIGKKPNLDELPFADRGLFKNKELPYFKNLKTPFATIISSRGCTYNCSFCQPSEKILFGKIVRRRSVKNVIEELNYLKKNYKINSFFVHDDCFTENMHYAEEFCFEYEKAGLSLKWACQTRADIVCKNPNLFKKMHLLGLSTVHIGFESGSQRVLNFLNKGITLEHIYTSNTILKEIGIEIMGMFMVGLPEETIEESISTFELMKHMKLEYPALSFFTPYPGSSLYEYCKEKNLLLELKDHDFDLVK